MEIEEDLRELAEIAVINSLRHELVCRDIESACDEKVIKDKDREYMAAYSQAHRLQQKKRISRHCPFL